MRGISVIFATLALWLAAPVHAETPVDIQRAFEAQARQQSPAFAGFSAARGERFFKATHGREWSCASCHTANPAAAGKHAKTDKPIQPLAPAANVQRFTRADKVEKWFRRNCNDVLSRACTPNEKGDVLAWLLSIRN